MPQTSRQQISYTPGEIVQEGLSGVSIRLARFTGTTAESWLNMQHQLDLWKLEQTQSKIYAKIKDFNTLKVAEAS